MTLFFPIIWASNLYNTLIVLDVRSAAKLFAMTADHLSQFVAPILIATIWQSLALAIPVALCLRVVPRTSATLRFTLWTAVLLLTCLLPLGLLSSPNTSSTPVFHATPHWGIVLGCLWLALSLLRAVDLLRNALRLRFLSRQAKPVPASAETKTLLRTHRNAALCTSVQLDRPAVIGFLHPRVLIPLWLFEQLTAPELQQIVLHELEHLRRRDDWLNLLQKFALVLFPLNPALYWIERRLCLERELACDEGVVRRTRAPRFYAACLARLAEHSLNHRGLSLAIGFLERQSELARRVNGILRAPRTLTPRQNLVLTGTVVALLLGGSAEVTRCPQLISFAPPSRAADMRASHLAPETWDLQPGAGPVLYTDAAVPHLLHASLKQARNALRKVNRHYTHPPVKAQITPARRGVPSELFATDTGRQGPPPAVINPAITPTLVRYTLVRVEGGWLLLQL